MKIAATPTTPDIAFDAATRTLEITGESYPENSFDFYRPVLAWVDDELGRGERLVVRLRVTYMNTSSVKCVMDLFDRLEDANEGGTPVEVVWLHRPGDERAKELGEEFAEDLTIPFTIAESAPEAG